MFSELSGHSDWVYANKKASAILVFCKFQYRNFRSQPKDLKKEIALTISDSKI